MSALRTYNLKLVTLIVGSNIITGYGDDGGIEFEVASDIFDDSVGADGEVTASYNNDQRVYATITMKENSEGCRLLDEAMRAQITAARSGAIPSLRFYMRDPINGDEISTNNAAFKTRPGPSKAKAAGTREFVILLPDGADDTLLLSPNSTATT